jgi:hypothetical protein
MKTIVEKDTNLSKFIVENDIEIILTENSIELPGMVVYGLNASNVDIFENVTQPLDWVGNKYKYLNSEWVLNPDWIDPENPISTVTIEERKNILTNELALIRKEVAVLITECQLVNNPQPQALIDLIDLSRNTYLRVKNDIDALSEDNYLVYHLQTEELNMLLNGFKSFL